MYKHQSKKIFASEKQANRARLTEAYMNWHHTVLGNDKNTILSGKMMRRGHVLVKDEHVEIHEESARGVHLLCLLLNTIFLEWNYSLMMDKVDLIFPDFPDEFITFIKWHVSEIRKRHAAVVAALPCEPDATPDALPS